jgi:kynurenine formamidase
VTQEQTRSDIERLFEDRNNWGRWGANDEVGALNLITAQKRVAAASLVTSGRTVSLSRAVPTEPAANNPRPSQHYLRRDPIGAVDYYGLEYHGQASTHIDALCHVFDKDGRLWNGRHADDVITSYGAKWAGIEKWQNGLVTRGVLLDVPAFRNERFVRSGRPVTACELAEVAQRQGIVPESGDALVIYSGRDRWDEENIVWGGEKGSDGVVVRPGVDPSCLSYIRDCDCSALAWDMMDAAPNQWGGIPWNVHGAIPSFGVALVDNCELGALSEACREEQRYEFLFMVAPLVVVGGTGSPANPLALF